MPVVVTGSGRVAGIDRGGVLQFRGLPYAAAPIGDLRWHPPQPPAPWAGIRQADRFGPVAPQVPSPLTLLPRADNVEISEDCLSLNVYTPSTDGTPRPVLVWIHGGAFTGGSGRNPWYNGSSFARQGVVVVTINYRLGALGFLQLGDEFPGSGNCGLLDQVAALRWVQDNIAAFGGDPRNVTVFGESAGAMSVGALLAMPAAEGLFQGAILQSGAASSASDMARAEETAARLVSRLGGLDALRSAPVERLLAAQSEVVAERGAPGGRLPFQPVVDRATLPHLPLESIRKGSAAGVRLLTGTTRDEMTLLLAAVPGWRDVSEEQVVRRVDRAVPGRGRSLYDAYRGLIGASAMPADLWASIETDRVFRIPAIHLAEAMGRRTPNVWMYLFTWESPALDGALGACHALELPFVWNTLSEATESFTGGGPEARALAEAMHGSWVRFAAGGDPGWPRYEAGRRITRVFGPGEEAAQDPRTEMRRLWDG